ncbi:hypothetical protein BJY59DRAFT_698633 [Rhodotorula toruloides]
MKPPRSNEAYIVKNHLLPSQASLPLCTQARESYELVVSLLKSSPDSRTGAPGLLLLVTRLVSPAPHLALPAPSTSPSPSHLASSHSRTRTLSHVDLSPADGAAGAAQGGRTPPLSWPLGREGGAEDGLHAHAPGGGARRRGEARPRRSARLRRAAERPARACPQRAEGPQLPARRQAQRARQRRGAPARRIPRRRPLNG